MSLKHNKFATQHFYLIFGVLVTHFLDWSISQGNFYVVYNCDCISSLNAMESILLTQFLQGYLRNVTLIFTPGT